MEGKETKDTSDFFIHDVTFKDEMNGKLFDACSKGNLSEAKELAASGADISDLINFEEFLTLSIRDNHSRELFAACASGRLTEAKRLLAEGADVNWQDEDGVTPLMKCVSWDRSHVTEWLLSIPGLDVDIAAENGKNVLHTACEKSFTKKETLLQLSRLCSQESHDTREKLYGYTPKLVAMRWGNKEAIWALLTYDSKSDQDIVDTYLVSALMRENFEEAQSLVNELGANPIWEGSIKLTDLSELFVKERSENLSRELVRACASGNALKAVLLVNSGADINYVGEGQTPLMRALSWDKHEVLQTLLNHAEIIKRINIDTADEIGQNALHKACARNFTRKETMRELLFLCSQDTFNAVDKLYGRTPVMVASRWSRTVASLSLLGFPIDGVDWWQADFSGQTALDIARTSYILSPESSRATGHHGHRITELLITSQMLKIKRDVDIFEKNMILAKFEFNLENMNFNDCWKNMQRYLLSKNHGNSILEMARTGGRRPHWMGEGWDVQQVESIDATIYDDRGDPLKGIVSDTDPGHIKTAIAGVGLGKAKNLSDVSILFEQTNNMKERSILEVTMIAKFYSDYSHEDAKQILSALGFPNILTLKKRGLKEKENHVVNLYENICGKDENSLFLPMPLKEESLDYLFISNDRKKIVDWIEDEDERISMSWRYFQNENNHALFKQLHITEGSQGQSLAQKVTANNWMVKEKEEMLDLAVQIENNNGEDAMIRVINNLKKGLESSSELTNCINTVKNKYPLPTGKFITMIITSFMINIIMGFTFYGSDVGSDVHFGKHMEDFYHLSIQDNGTENIECKDNFYVEVTEINESCKDDSGVLSSEGLFCQENLEEALEIMDDCFFKEYRRFSDPEDWQSMAIISLSHCITPFLMAGLVCLIVGTKGKWYNIPLPFITKIYMFLIDLKLFKQRRANDQESKESKGKLIEILEERIMHENTVKLSTMIESSSESTFQFFFQTTYLVPTIVLNFSKASGSNDINILFNLRMFSILSSFFTVAFSYFSIRNKDKKGALGSLHLTIIVLRIVFDAVARISIFSAWLYLYNDGEFGPISTAVGFYSVLGILIVFNSIFNREKYIYKPECLLGILLNSFGSILSYNYYDFRSIFHAKKEKRHLHETSLVRQIIFFCLFTLLFISLTLWTAVLISKKTSDEMTIHDQYGTPVSVPLSTVQWMLVCGWISHFIAVVLGVVYYASHPSSVALSPVGKSQVWVLGHKIILSASWPVCSIGQRGGENTNADLEKFSRNSSKKNTKKGFESTGDYELEPLVSISNGR